jgi:23S rRNA (guanosine2251-2'-O)-methyltransferase
MKEFLYSRNAVYEALRAKRRDVFRIQIAEGVQEKGRLTDVLRMAKDRRIPVEKVQRARLDKVHQNHQGVAAEVSGYVYSDTVEILDHATQKNEPPSS